MPAQIVDPRALYDHALRVGVRPQLSVLSGDFLEGCQPGGDCDKIKILFL